MENCAPAALTLFYFTRSISTTMGKDEFLLSCYTYTVIGNHDISYYSLDIPHEPVNYETIRPV